MRFIVDWFAWEVVQGIEFLKDYVEKMEEQLRQTHKNELKLLNEKRRELDEADYSIQYSGIEQMYEWEFPRNLRYSFVILLHIFLETKIMATCDEIRTRRNIAENIRSLDGGKISRAKRYLRKHADIKLTEVDWIAIDALESIRNCIAHASGNVSISRNKEKLEKGSAVWPGYRILNDQIFLSAQFIKWQIKAAELLCREILREGAFGPSNPIIEQDSGTGRISPQNP